MAHKLVKATVLKWHKILSYVGPNAIRQLPKHVNGIELTELTNKQVPLKIKYKVCLVLKHIQQISCRQEYEFPAT